MDSTPPLSLPATEDPDMAFNALSKWDSSAWGAPLISSAPSGWEVRVDPDDIEWTGQQYSIRKATSRPLPPPITGKSRAAGLSKCSFHDLRGELRNRGYDLALKHDDAIRLIGTDSYSGHWNNS
jgi:hypothetical protein